MGNSAKRPPSPTVHPLLAAVKSRRPGQALVLLRRTPIDAATLHHALYLAVQCNELCVVRALLGKPGQLDQPPPAGFDQPLLTLAVRTRNPDLVTLLLQAGVDVQGRAQDGHHHTALMDAVNNSRSTRMVQLLLDAGADTEARTAHGFTALLLAVAAGHVQQARLLLQAGADIHAKTRLGRTAWVLACTHGRVGLARLVLEHGGQVGNARVRSKVLATAIERQYVEIVRLLLQQGCDPWNAGWRHDRALQLAKHHQRPRDGEEIVRLIVDWEAKHRILVLLAGTRRRRGREAGEGNSLTRLAVHPLFDPNVLGQVYECLTGLQPPFMSS